MVNSSIGPLIVPFGLELVHITRDFLQAVCSTCRPLLVSCLAYPSTLKIKVIYSSETSGFLHTTQHYNPEDCTLHSHCCEKLRSNKKFAFFLITVGSRDSSVGIATGYGLDDRVPVGSNIFTSPYRPDRLWGPPNLLKNGYRGLFTGGKAAGAWSWPLTSN
jgi:hypothetical protein